MLRHPRRGSAALLPAALALAAPAVLAQSPDRAAAPKPAAAAPAAATAEGEVRKVGKAKGRVTLRHGPLSALGMPPMTMAFAFGEPGLLAGVKEGDKLRFTPAQAKDGTRVITAPEVVR